MYFSTDEKKQQEARSQKPEAGSQKQDARSKKLENSRTREPSSVYAALKHGAVDSTARVNAHACAERTRRTGDDGIGRRNPQSTQCDCRAQQDNSRCCVDATTLSLLSFLSLLPLAMRTIAASAPTAIRTACTSALRRLRTSSSSPALPPLRAMSATTRREDPFKPAARVAGQKQDVW